MDETKRANIASAPQCRTVTALTVLRRATLGTSGGHERP